jgi:hypothetical protein
LEIINDELSTYHSITTAVVGNGASTAFWLDHWLDSGPISTSHPALFSHTLRPNVSVHQVFQNGFEMHLRPRLTAAAHSELNSILSILQGIQLQDKQDTRLMSLTCKPFNTKDAYAALAPSLSVQDLHGRWIWKSRVPNKVKKNFMDVLQG